MKIRIFKKDDGTVDMYFERTRPKENRNLYLKGVKVTDVTAVAAKEIAAMRGETAVVGQGEL